MKHMLKRFFSVAALLSTMAVYGSVTTPVVEVTPLFLPRSQGVDAARELSGWTQHVNLFDMDKVYGTLALTVEYARSFRADNIAQSLFGSALNCASGCNESSINISGSHTSNVGTNDLLADYFYLPTNFQSTVNFSPRIESVVADLNFYLGFDEWCNGLFFRLDLPINWTRWNLNMCETIVATGSLNYDPGYFNDFNVPGSFALGIQPVGIEYSKLNTSFTQYAGGVSPAGTHGTTLNGLCYAKMDCGARSLTGLADLQAIFGWNFLNDEDYHLGVGLLVRAPTGNRPNAEYLFEPIVGNGHHWELGAHITSHATLWRCENEESSLGFYLDANITHLFKDKQRRTFDLTGKPLSRYMLAEKFQTPAVAPMADAGATFATSAAPTYQFANVITPVANLTTQDVNVSIGVQGDLAAQFTYANGGFNWDLGYNFWGRSCEKFSCITPGTASGCPASACVPCDLPSGPCPIVFAANTWGLKGDAYVYGFDFGLATIAPGSTAGAPATASAALALSAVPGANPPTPVPLAATESLATINNGTNFPPTGAITLGQRNPPTFNSAVDAAALAFNSVSGDQLGEYTFDATETIATGANPVDTSSAPVFIAATSFDYAGTRGISNKIYTNLSYNWVECDDWVPYVGIGAFGEWGSGSSCNTGCNSSTTCPASVSTCASSCGTSSCVNAALSQWGVWIKGGVSFN